MGLSSMTGYGEAQAELLGRRLLVQVRSVNHRHLDLRCRMPRALAALEGACVALARQRIGRGKVEITVTLGEALSEQGTGVVVDATLARAYWAQAEALARSLGVASPAPDLGLLLSLPEVVRIEEPRGADAAGQAVLEATLDAALDRFLEQRAAEGDALQRDLLPRCAALEALAAQAGRLAPEVVADHQERVRRRVAHLVEESGGTIDPARMVQELALLADRLDVQEELTRLEHHLSSLRRIFEGDEDEGPQGRRLDFLLQETGREINTLGSKANDLRVADLVVEMKAEIERIREQVQNLE